MSINKCIPKELANELKKQFKLNKDVTPAEIKAKIDSIVKKKYSIDLDDKVSSNIIELTNKLNDSKKNLGDNLEKLGSIDGEKETIAFLKAQNELTDVLKSLSPSKKTDVFLGVIGRGSMLASPKSMVMNIEGNIMTALTQGIVRRITGGNLGKVGKLQSDYIKMVRKVYKETGVDLSRVKDSKDFYNSAELLLGKDVVSTQGVKGPIGAWGRLADKVVYRNMLGVPDSFFGSLNFTDSLMIDISKYDSLKKIDDLITKAIKENDTQLANNLTELKTKFGNKNITEELFKDASQIEPKTKIGKELRESSVQESKVSTLVQNTATSDLLNGLRTTINKATKSRVGDYVLPFVKTPANVISMGLDYAGKGAIKGIIDIIKGVSNGTIKDPKQIKKIATNIAKTGVGIVGAQALVSAIGEDNFVGAYDPKRQQIEQLKNSSYDAVKIGDKYYSLDFFGPLAIPMAATFYAKKGDGFIDKSYQYFLGAKEQTLKLPGVDLAKSINDNLKSKKELGDATTSLQKEVVNEASSRIVPAVVGDIAKVIDKYERKSTEDIFGGFKSKIPGLRQTLPAKENVFNQKIETENPLSVLLAGSRIKTDKSTPVIKEVDRVFKNTGKTIQFTNFDTSGTKEITQFKEKIGPERFNEAKVFYGTELQKQLGDLIKNPRYSLMSNEQKLEQIKKQSEQAKDNTFRKFGFKYKQEKTTKSPSL